MAGIGFELKKLFRKEGIFANLRAYGYSGVICAGPMLLGVVLLLEMMLLCRWAGTSHLERELLVCMITYTLLASLLVTSFFSMVVSRFISDMLYEEREETILPSFWGSTGIMLVPGGIAYGIFLLFSGAGLTDGLLCLWLFSELIVVWNAMSYLTAIKDYKGILLSFLSAVAVAFVLGYVLIRLGVPTLQGLLFAVCTGYGVMLLWDVVLLHRYFPLCWKSPFLFLRWIDAFLPLALSGLFVTIGLMSHLVIMWCGPLRVQVKGLFYGAPQHDVPALLAFLTILVTTVNFVVSVEVNFYPKYREYYSRLNDGGVIGDVKESEREMLIVLKSELGYTALKQLIATALAIALGNLIVYSLPLGFNDLMFGYFQTLCVGYGFYAVGNMTMLMQLYFTDYRGALMSTGVFALCSTVFTIISLAFDADFFGFGFLAGSAIFCLLAIFRLNTFSQRLPFYVLSRQPIVAEDKSSVFTRIEAFLEEKTERSRNIETNEP